MQQRQIEGSDAPACAVLVLSCDQYRDLWTPFFKLFERYWPDCGMPVYLGTNCARVNLDWVQTLNAGNDEAWSRRLRFFLNSLDTEYVLLLLEDFFLDQAVRNEDVSQHLLLLHSLEGTEMRLFPNPPPDYVRGRFGVLHGDAWYRVSLQAAIWNRQHLLGLLVDEESPWQFELRGTKRSQGRSGFYSAPHAVIHYQHVVERGEWFRHAARFYAEQDTGCDFKARRTIGLLQSFKKRTANRMRKLANFVHSRWLCMCYPEKAEHGA